MTHRLGTEVLLVHFGNSVNIVVIGVNVLEVVVLHYFALCEEVTVRKVQRPLLSAAFSNSFGST